MGEPLIPFWNAQSRRKSLTYAAPSLPKHPGGRLQHSRNYPMPWELETTRH
jgi:hypothetical protein